MINDTQESLPHQPKDVTEGHYNLCTPDNSIILPRHWASLVKPEMSIRMLLWQQQDSDRKAQTSDSRASAPETLSLGPPELTSSKTLDPSETQTIVVTDSLGQDFELPLEMCRTKVVRFPISLSFWEMSTTQITAGDGYGNTGLIRLC